MADRALAHHGSGDLVAARALCQQILSIDRRHFIALNLLGVISGSPRRWRWLLDRDDSPWYPTVRLYRQSRPGDWTTTLRRVAADLLAAFEVA